MKKTGSLSINHHFEAISSLPKDRPVVGFCQPRLLAMLHEGQQRADAYLGVVKKKAY